MTRLLWTARAEGRLHNELEVLREYSEAAAETFALQISGAANVLLRFPDAGFLLTDDNIRKYVVPGTDYVLLYRHFGGVVTVIAFYHGREDWISRYGSPPS